MVKSPDVQELILSGLNTGKKITLPPSCDTSPEIHVLCVLWNLAVIEGDVAERVDIATRLIKSLPK